MYLPVTFHIRNGKKDREYQKLVEWCQEREESKEKVSYGLN